MSASGSLATPERVEGQARYLMSAVADRPSTTDRIRAALWFAQRGFGVFSVWSTTETGECRCPLGPRCDAKSRGKHPVTRNGFLDATTDPTRIQTFLSAGSEPNYGLVCPEGVFALDVDGEGIARLAELQEKYGPLPPTLTTSTAHGFHIFLRWPKDLPRPIGQLFGYVTRWGSGANAGYVIGPRSVHATGAVYAPVGNAFEVATLPDAWASSVIDHVPAAGTITIGPGAYEMPERIPASESRYEAIRTYTAHLYNREIAVDEMWPLVRDLLAPRFEEPLTEPDLRARFNRVTEKIGERLTSPVSRREVRRVLGPGIDAADLIALDLQPLRWIVPDLIPEGTTILAAPPKVGKSCLVYQIAVEAAIGGELLGRRVTTGSVLYLALEDGKRRGRDRLLSALAGRTMPHGRLEVRWDANRIGAGLEDDIGTWLDEHPDAAMVALDTLGKVRPRSTGKQGAYEVDVQDLAQLQSLFRNKPVSLLIVHHARKEASDDFLASVSGTYGITGSADTIVAIRRKRLERFGTILTTGRDIADAEIPVQFDDGRWLAAPGALPEASVERSEVYEVIERRGPIFPQAVADHLGLTRQSVQNMVAKLVATGAVARVPRGYVVAGVTLNTSRESLIGLNTPDVSDVSNSHQRHQGEVSRTRARDADLPPTSSWCHFFVEHQSHHRDTQTAEPWCEICTPRSAA